MKYILLLLWIVLLGCNSGGHVLKKIIHIQGRTMGTTYNIKAVVHQDYIQTTLEEMISKRLIEVNQAMSTYIKDSEISKFNQSLAGAPMIISADFSYVLSHALEVAKKTDGVFDPTIGPLVNLWGFGPEGERKKPTKEQVEAVKKYVGYEKITLDHGKLSKTSKEVYLDLSASAKGFGVDAVIDVLKKNNIQNAMVEIGGEVRTMGESLTRPWKIGVEKPVEGSFDQSVVKVVTIKDVALATSGSYRNFFKNEGKSYSHTIDYKSGAPVETSLVSVSVISDNCMDADAYATALMAMGTEKAIEFSKKNKLKSYLIYSDPANIGKFKFFESEEFKKASM